MNEVLWTWGVAVVSFLAGFVFCALLRGNDDD